jgi:hypothetical protein
MITILSVSLYAACVTVAGSALSTNRRLEATGNYGVRQSARSEHPRAGWSLQNCW